MTEHGRTPLNDPERGEPSPDAAEHRGAAEFGRPVTVGADEVWDGDELLETWTTPSGVQLARIRPTEAHVAQMRADFVALFGEPVQLVQPYTVLRDASRRRRR